jgi:hypothetical protein
LSMFRRKLLLGRKGTFPPVTLLQCSALTGRRAGHSLRDPAGA